MLLPLFEVAGHRKARSVDWYLYIVTEIVDIIGLVSEVSEVVEEVAWHYEEDSVGDYPSVAVEMICLYLNFTSLKIFFKVEILPCQPAAARICFGSLSIITWASLANLSSFTFSGASSPLENHKYLFHKILLT